MTEQRVRLGSLADGRDPGMDSLAAKSGESVKPLPGTGFEVDCAKRSWGEILRVIGRLLALATGGKR